MLVLMLHLGKDRFALPTESVVEVIPCIRLRHVPGAPDFVAGLCDYRGQTVPVVDLVFLACQRQSEPLLSTRIVLLAPPGAPLFGVIAEGITETEQLDPASLRTTGVEAISADFAGPVMSTMSGQTVQLLELDRVMPESLRAMLLTQALEAKS